MDGYVQNDIHNMCMSEKHNLLRQELLYFALSNRHQTYLTQQTIRVNKSLLLAWNFQ